MAVTTSFFLLILMTSCMCHAYNASTDNYIRAFNISYSPWTPLSNLTLISPNSTFAAGFLPLMTAAATSAHLHAGNNSNYDVDGLYSFSVWFFADPSRTPVWSHASHDIPLASSATLSISSSDGSLYLINTTSTTGPNSSSSINLLPGTARSSLQQPRNSSLTLSESGELSYGLWTSFDHPTDTILPGQPINLNRTVRLVSGGFSWLNSSALAFNVSDVYWSPNNDQWRTQNFTEDGLLLGQGAGNKLMTSDYGERGRHRRLTLAADGNLRVYSLIPGSADGPWRVTWRAIQEICTVHGLCGSNSFCALANMSDADVYSCKCLDGFDKGPNNDCVRRVPLRGDSPAANTFIRMDYVDFTGGLNQTDRQPPTLTICRTDCLNNQKCLGFSYKFDGSQYCVHQIGSLRYGYWSPRSEVAFFLKVDKSAAGPTNFTSMMTIMDTACPIIGGLPVPPKGSGSGRTTLAITGSLFVLELLIGALSFWALLRKFIKYRDMARVGIELLPSGGPKRFSYPELKSATNNFSDIVGSGGYGVVYRGKLPDGRVIAVKRLKGVDPGTEADFWAEVTIIARMHHLNLVRLWGFCAEKGERILVYEYIANGSLAKFIFAKPAPQEQVDVNDPAEPTLDWDIRYRIAMGVARAIAYLHEECLEWVLHCDIKPENILLEDDFCPKVSDFGLAKLANNKKDVVSMSRIRGTRGYLAPEWVRDEPITPKADVYSYGMVLLELVSGTRNFDYTMATELDSADWYFPKWAYEKMYIEKKMEDILDPRIVNQCDSPTYYIMIQRMVKTAMWCLQDRPESRPSMGRVTKMLEGTVELLEPGKPTIFYLSEGDRTMFC